MRPVSLYRSLILFSIRPLQTPDLRARRVSGRHQITEDGRHLVDGVAFGRALLRKPSRPSIHIPPRKRRRLLTNEEEDDSILPQSLNQQIALRTQSDDLLDTNFEDGEASDEEQDSDFLDEDELDDEVHDIQDDQGNGLGLILNADGTPYDGSEGDQDGEGRGSFPQRITNEALRPAKRRLITAREVSRNTTATVGEVSKDLKVGERRPSSGSNKSVRFEDEDTGTPATIRLSQDTDDDEDSDDDDFAPNEFDVLDKENAPPSSRSDDTSTSEDEDSEIDSDTSSISSSSIDVSADEDETSSSGSSSNSSSNASSESEPEETSSKKATPSKNSVDASSSATSLSESDSDSDVGSDSKAPHVSPTTSVEDVQQQANKTVQLNKPDGAGTRGTRTRNTRRKNRDLLLRLVKKGLLPSGSSVEDAVRFRGESQNAKQQQVRPESAENKAGAADIEARREALLKSIDSGGVDVNEDLITSEASPQEQDKGSESLKGSEQSIDAGVVADDQEKGANGSVQSDEVPPVVQVKDSLDQAGPELDESITHDPVPVASEIATMMSADASQARASKTPQAPQSTKSGENVSGGSARRSRLDLAGSKRLLFGSLGLKTPKTKEDGIKLQEKLMSNVKPVKQPTSSVKEGESTAKSALTAEDDESWRDKIELSAVECWDYDVELSAPSFPFVQRWDPQYQRNSGGSKRKQKKRKRNDTSYYENQYDDSFNEGAANKSPRREDYNPITEEALFDKIANEVDIRDGSKQDDSQINGQDAQAASQQLIRETVSSSNEAMLAAEDDLPTLPTNLSICSALGKDDCKAGAIVAFKKFELELGNEWHPYISEYRTAQVVALHDNGEVEMTYAKRDIPADRRRYDEETGERILGKLEMPGYDSDSEEVDPSKVKIDFAELIEPLLIRAAEASSPLLVEQSQLEERDDTQEPEESSSQISAQNVLSTPAEARSRLPLVKQSDDVRADIPQSSQNSSANLEYHDAETREDGQSDNHVTAPQNHSQEAPHIVADSQPQPQPQPNTQTREDMSQVFRDAGWRSSIGPDIRRMLQLEQKESIEAPPAPESPSREATPPSSAFHGFSSPGQSQDDPPASAQSDTQSTTHASGQIPDSATRADTTADSVLLRTEHSIEYPALPDMDDSSLLASQHSPTPPSHQPTKPSPPPISPPALRNRASDLPNQVDGAAEEKSSKEDIPSYTFLSDASISSEEFPEIFSQSFEKRLSQQPLAAPSPSPKKSSISSSKVITTTKTKVKRESTRSTSPTDVPPVKKETKTSRARKLFTRPSFTSLRPSSSQGEGKRTSSGVFGALKSKKSAQQIAASQVTIDENSGFDDSFWPRFTQSQPARGESQRETTPALTQESDIVDLTMSSDGPAFVNDDDVGTYESVKVDTSSGSLPAGSGWISKKGKGKKAGRSFP